MYKKFGKRIFDLLFCLLFFIFFGWVLVVIAAVVKVNIGSPIVFRQPRPGKIDPKTGKERIFILYKFRTMTNATDQRGRLLPDEQRLGKFGKALRATSLDELPEIVNIVHGDMSLVGPRPQLVRDMVFMTREQRFRHSVRPGLTGLAQVKGRNALSWDEKISCDIKYVENINFCSDMVILFKTFSQVFIRKDITKSSTEIDIADDFGDYLLKKNRITREQYNKKQEEARELLKAYSRVDK